MRLLFIAFLTAGLLVGCASTTELKAPCDYQGHFCGQKIMINQ